MAQKTDPVIDPIDLAIGPASNGHEEAHASRRGSWSTLIDAHADLFRAEAETAARDWSRAFFRSLALAFCAVSSMVFLNIAVLYGMTRTGLSWGASSMFMAAFWGAAGGAIYLYGRNRERAPAFAATQRQIRETARWFGSRFF